MRTTVDLDEGLVAEAMALTHARTKTELLERGLQALIDLESRKTAIRMGGTMPGIEVPPRRGGSPPEALDPTLGPLRNPHR
jgi:hypothetical protein